jgi:DNA end-binding protein Ku
MASLWSGYLTFGLISMPVRLFAGARSENVSFHMLHRDDLVRVKQQLTCPAENKVIDRSEVVKGYEFRKGEYVVIEPEEIKKIEPKTAKAMEILEFVPAKDIDPVYFESSYFLMPEEAGRKPYALLEKALEETGFYGIAKLTMHNREYTVILRPSDGGIMLHTMYYADEVREVEGFGDLKVQVKPAELKVATQLVNALSGEWKPEQYSDTFQENLKKMIAAKLEGEEVTAVEKPKKPAPVVDLMEALKASLAQSGKAGKKPVASEKKTAASSEKHRKKPPRKAA